MKMVRDSVWGGLHATLFESLVGDKFLIVEKKVGEWVWDTLRHVHTAIREEMRNLESSN